MKSLNMQNNIASLFLMLLLISSVMFAQKNVNVNSTEQFVSAIKNLNGIGEIIFSDGTYEINESIELNITASKEHPFRIAADNPGKVEIKGTTQFILTDCSFVVIEGIIFTSTNSTVIKITGSNNCRVSNNHFKLAEKEKGSWILIDGAKSNNNRIDHNLFENKKLLGNFVTIEGTMAPDFQVSQNDKIDHNHFRNIGPRIENALEAIRVGSSHVSLSSGFTLIESNLFERCDGDPEIVSIKSSDDTVRYNTFRECLGVLSLRHGNRNTIDGNYFLGNNRSGEFLDNTGKKWVLGTGGIRFYGDNMKIINNYFENLTGEKWDGTLALTNGDADYGMGLSLTKHYRPRYSVVAFNTFVNNKSSIEIGYDGEGFQNNWWKMPPLEIIIANNIIISKQTNPINIYMEPINSSWMGNIIFSSTYKEINNFDKNEIRIENEVPLISDGVFTINSNSRLRGKTIGHFPYINHDIDGQKRLEPFDPGCDQISNSLKINKPLTQKDVGPLWLRN